MILFVKRAYSRRRQGRRFNGSRCLRRTASENKLACLKRRAWTMAGHKGAENGCSSMERDFIKNAPPTSVHALSSGTMRARNMRTGVKRIERMRKEKRLLLWYIEDKVEFYANISLSFKNFSFSKPSRFHFFFSEIMMIETYHIRVI